MCWWYIALYDVMYASILCFDLAIMIDVNKGEKREIFRKHVCLFLMADRIF